MLEAFVRKKNDKNASIIVRRDVYILREGKDEQGEEELRKSQSRLREQGKNEYLVGS